MLGKQGEWCRIGVEEELGYEIRVTGEGLEKVSQSSNTWGMF